MNKVLVVIAIVLIFQFSNLIKPSVSVYNQTDKVIYLYAGSSQDGVDPDYDEIKASRRPILISVGETAHIRLAYSDLWKPERALYIGWHRGERYPQTTPNAGYNKFNITSEPGVCFATIIIKKDESVIRPDRTFFCYKYLKSASE